MKTRFVLAAVLLSVLSISACDEFFEVSFGSRFSRHSYALEGRYTVFRVSSRDFDSHYRTWPRFKLRTCDGRYLRPIRTCETWDDGWRSGKTCEVMFESTCHRSFEWDVY